MRGHSSASFLLLSGILAQTTSALALYNLSITRQGDDGADPLLLRPVFGVPQNDSGLPNVRLPLTATAMADLAKAENTRCESGMSYRRKNPSVLSVLTIVGV